MRVCVCVCVCVRTCVCVCGNVCLCVVCVCQCVCMRVYQMCGMCEWSAFRCTYFSYRDGHSFKRCVALNIAISVVNRI